MRLLWCALTLLIASCAEVPATVCFSNENCADAGNSRLDGGLDGGIDGGTGGGTGGGNAGGGAGGGGGSLPDVYASNGIPDRWIELTTALPGPANLPPVFSVTELTLDGGTMPSAGCDLFRGAVSLIDERVIAIPFCTNRFAVLDPRSLEGRWLDPQLLPIPPHPDQGHFGGAVLGCDGRVYALPYNDEPTVKRITALGDGGFQFDDLPMSTPGPFFFSGGVIAQPCSKGFLIIAAGQGGLYALEPSETNVTVRPISAGASTARFNGVARLSDTEVISATPVGSELLTVRVDSNTLLPTLSRTLLDGPVVGIATRRTGDAFVVTTSGSGYPILSSGPGPSRTLIGTQQRWPTNSTDGWIFSAGRELLSWNEATPPPNDLVSLDPAVNEAGTPTSGGLLMTPSGTLVNLPGIAQRTNVITLYVPSDGRPPPGKTALSPFFNKL